MNIGSYIKNILKEQGRSQAWIADKLELNEKTFSGKLKRNNITGEELLKIAQLLGINLEELKGEI